MTESVFLRCIDPGCHATLDVDSVVHGCPLCGGLVDVAYDWDRLPTPGAITFFAERWGGRGRPLDLSGVWRFRELLPFAREEELVTIGEGQTLLQTPDVRSLDLDLMPGRLGFQYEGLNPSGSFKDNGMAAAFTMARRLGRRLVACASTGNTSASMAMYASLTRLPDGRPMRGIVFVGSGKIALGKLSQALDYGAQTLQVDGDFDACMRRIREASDRLGLYLMNSVNPFRLEGQKTIMYRVLEGMSWEAPDWIVVPGGNLGNTSAFGKAFMELQMLGLVSHIPRLAVVNAAGADTLCALFNDHGLRWNGGEWDRECVTAFYGKMDGAGVKASTIATAIEIARPVNLAKALRSLDVMNGVVCRVTDDAILEEKARIGRTGFGCEPASAASLAGLRQLLSKGVIDRGSRVVCILTGHALKDPDATVMYHMGREEGGAAAPPRRFSNSPVRVADDPDAICRAIGQD
ncbi:MAG: threonine synthase [Planctomycetota bacterium]|nr:MAG: threonine synthase [Planctomycetota bacterium]